MENETIFAARRIKETAFIEVVTSVLVYFVAISGIMPSTVVGYIWTFGASALAFLVLNYIVLSAHFRAVRYKTQIYLKVNLSIFAFGVLSNALALKCFPDGIYTALFAYTKPFRHIFKVSNLISSAIFWGLYLLLILSVTIICKKRKYKR